jgi:competence protein ComEC
MPKAGLSCPAAVICGAVSAYAWFFLQAPMWLVAAFLLPAIYLGIYHRYIAAFAYACGLLLTALALQWQMDDRYPYFVVGERVEIDGRISGLPQVMESYTRFRFLPLDAGPISTGTVTDRVAAARQQDLPASPPDQIPKQILVNWYRDAPELLPGQTWRLQLQVKPPWGLVNFQGHDRERWLFAEGIGAQATVRQGELLQDVRWQGWLDRVRQQISQDIAAASGNAENAGVIRALAVADTSGLDKSQRNSLAVTGTAHLLAISGLHVGLAYLLAFGLARLLLLPFGRWLPDSQLLCLVSGWLVACMYAGLAGFSTATVRALVMLSVILLLLVARRRIRPLQSLMLALAVVLLTEPLAPLQAGTWMSFIAVAALMLWFMPRRSNPGGWLSKSLQAQTAVMLVCFPFTAWWFQMSSPAGFFANLLAIPWVSFVVVPLVLLAMVLWPVNQALFEGLVTLANQTADLLMWLLRVLATWVQDYSTVLQPSWLSLTLAVLAAVLMLLPRGLRVHAPAALLLLPLLLPASPVAANRVRLEVLDAGQGTALLLQTGSHLLLYDSGPGSSVGRSLQSNPGNGLESPSGSHPEEIAAYDLVDSVIHPAILANGFSRPDRIIISHGDLDHAGGLASLQQKYSSAPVFASLPVPLTGVQACTDELSWNWQGSHFRVLHPSPYLPYKGNDSSCVLEVDVGQFKLLLTGDISSRVEKRLTGRGLDVSRILLVPHHGSRSSSATELLHATVPELALATAGIGNRFDFPRAEVRQRYLDAGIRFLSTNRCGAISLEVEGDGTLQMRSARRVRAAPWRWPAGSECP